MKKVILILLMGIFLINLVSAENPTFQVNTEFDLKRGCSNNGFFCDSVFICNITIISPDGSLLRDNIVMTDSESYRNITLTPGQNNQLGFMKAIESCNNGTVGGFDSFEISITADGKPFQQFPTQFAIIILGFLLIGTGFFTERLRVFKYMGGILLMVMGVITLYPGYSFINWTTLTGKVLGFIAVGMGFYFLIEDSFSRTSQEERYYQDQGDTEEEFDE